MSHSPCRPPTPPTHHTHTHTHTLVVLVQFVDGFKSLVIPSHLRPPAQAINWIPLTGDSAIDQAMRVGWKGAGGQCMGRGGKAACLCCLPPAAQPALHNVSVPCPAEHAFVCARSARVQRQVSGALEAIRGVLVELAERIAEQGLEAEVGRFARRRRAFLTFFAPACCSLLCGQTRALWTIGAVSLAIALCRMQSLTRCCPALAPRWATASAASSSTGSRWVAAAGQEGRHNHHPVRRRTLHQLPGVQPLQRACS